MNLHFTFGATIQLVGGTVSFEPDKLFTGNPICRTLFFHALPQAIYLFQFVCGDKYLFQFLRIFFCLGFQTRPSIDLVVIEPSEAMFHKLIVRVI